LFPQFCLNYKKLNFSSIVQRFFFYKFFIIEFLFSYLKIIYPDFCCLKISVIYSKFFKWKKISFKNFSLYLIVIFLQSLDVETFKEQIINLKMIFLEKQISFFFFYQNAHPLLDSLKKKIKARVFF